MALNTLKEVTSIGDFEVGRAQWMGMQLKNIVIDDVHNIITFKLQDGPIKEHGVNGCQVDTIIEAAMMILQGLDEQHHCVENSHAINYLEEALLWLEQRKLNREKRGVEGTDED